jgi:hypothetical protein
MPTISKSTSYNAVTYEYNFSPHWRHVRSYQRIKCVVAGFSFPTVLRVSTRLATLFNELHFYNEVEREMPVCVHDDYDLNTKCLLMLFLCKIE